MQLAPAPPQVGEAHWPFMHVSPTAQLRPQAPQFAGLSTVWISHPFEAARSQSAHPTLHVYEHCRVPDTTTHDGVAFGRDGQMVPHAPQLRVEPSEDSQPFEAVLSQSAKPVLQLAMAHAPPVQAAVAFARVQRRPQTPQLSASALRLTHRRLQQAVEPPTTGGHGTPQTPQFPISEFRS